MPKYPWEQDGIRTPGSWDDVRRIRADLELRKQKEEEAERQRVEAEKAAEKERKAAARKQTIDTFTQNVGKVGKGFTGSDRREELKPIKPDKSTQNSPFVLDKIIKNMRVTPEVSRLVNLYEGFKVGKTVKSVADVVTRDPKGFSSNFSKMVGEVSGSARREDEKKYGVAPKSPIQEAWDRGVKGVLVPEDMDMIMTTPVGEKVIKNIKPGKESVFQSALEGFVTGDLNNKIQMEYYKASVGRPNNLAYYEKLLADNPQLQAEIPFDFKQAVKNKDIGTIFKHMLRGTAQQIPMMVQATLSGASRGATYGLIGASVAGAGGAAIPAPEEIVTVPGAAAAGFALGQGTGTFDYYQKLMAGGAYKDMLELGIDSETAAAASQVVGAVNAAIEQAQFGGIVKRLPGGEKVMKLLQKNVQNRILNTFFDYGKFMLKEGIFEEGLQEIASIAGEEVSKVIDNLNGKQLEYATKNDILGRLGETAKESMLSMALMPVPGMVQVGAVSAAEGVVSAAQATAQKIQTNRAKADFDARTNAYVSLMNESEKTKYDNNLSFYLENGLDEQTSKVQAIADVINNPVRAKQKQQTAEETMNDEAAPEAAAPKIQVPNLEAGANFVRDFKGAVNTMLSQATDYKDLETIYDFMYANKNTYIEERAKALKDKKNYISLKDRRRTAIQELESLVSDVIYHDFGVSEQADTITTPPELTQEEFSTPALSENIPPAVESAPAPIMGVTEPAAPVVEDAKPVAPVIEDAKPVTPAIEKAPAENTSPQGSIQEDDGLPQYKGKKLLDLTLSDFKGMTDDEISQYREAADQLYQKLPMNSDIKEDVWNVGNYGRLERNNRENVKMLSALKKKHPSVNFEDSFFYRDGKRIYTGQVIENEDGHLEIVTSEETYYRKGDVTFEINDVIDKPTEADIKKAAAQSKALYDSTISRLQKGIQHYFDLDSGKVEAYGGKEENIQLTKNHILHDIGRLKALNALYGYEMPNVKVSADGVPESNFELPDGIKLQDPAIPDKPKDTAIPDKPKDTAKPDKPKTPASKTPLKTLRQEIDYALSNWHEGKDKAPQKMFKGFTRSDMDELELYAETWEKQGNFDGLMPPRGKIADILNKYGMTGKAPVSSLRDPFQKSQDSDKIEDTKPQKDIKTGKATWRNKDADQPIEITGYAGNKDGRDYVNIKGSDTAVPLDEITYDTAPKNEPNKPAEETTPPKKQKDLVNKQMVQMVLDDEFLNKAIFNNDEDTMKQLAIDDKVIEAYEKILVDNAASNPEVAKIADSLLTKYKDDEEHAAKVQDYIYKELKKKADAAKQAKENPVQQIADIVKESLADNMKFTNNALAELAKDVYGASLAENKYTIKDIYDAMELGVNQWLLEQKNIDLTAKDQGTVLKNLEALEKVLELLPTQTNRTEEQNSYQQFSTPPTIAYLASWVANITGNDTALEPSAGIGGLAVFAKANGAEVIVNELDPRRAEILKLLKFDKTFTENAEQLNNILPKDIKPTVVIMNPPFTSTAGRMGDKKSSKFATAHIEQALKRLQPGGRLVAIVGKGMGHDAPQFKDWFYELGKEYNIRANVGIHGSNYKKYGTSFGIQMLVIDKNGATTSTITDQVKDLNDVVKLLGGIRNDRQTTTDRQGESNANKPNSPGTPKQGESGSRPQHDIQLPADGLGDTQAGLPSRGDGSKQGINDSGNKNPDVSGKAGLPDGTSETSKPQSAEQAQTPGSSGEPDRGLEVRTPGERPDASGKGLKKELTENVFTRYIPKKLKIDGAVRHPAILAESAAMSAVDPPDINVTLHIPKELITSGALSLEQLEPIAYAEQSFQQTLPDGTRRGFYIGDGTGVGKAREIIGIIMNHFKQGGVPKAVWISKNTDLYKDAKNEYGELGQDKKDMFNLPKVGSEISRDGILFTTYGSLVTNFENTNTDGKLKLQDPKKQSRIDQIVNWLGKDFDGVIAFDEAHMMANSVTQKGARGTKQATKAALAGIELQRRLPKAKVVYASATAATEVANLGYADRLGLWGDGTEFRSKFDFISKISAGGLAAMELVARDMKAMGVYLARSISYDGVKYETLEHPLTNDQIEIYDTLAESWQIILNNLYKALDLTNQVKDGKKRGNAASMFWSANQSFFNQILTAMQMPTVIENVKKDLAAGNSVVFQIVNTNAAAQEREIARAQEEETDLEDMDFTPREKLIQYLLKSFPVDQYETYIDDNGNEKSRPVVDSQGQPVLNQEAVEARDALIEKISSLKVPDNPLDMIISAFGADNVAEITGRNRRVIEKEDGDTGKIVKKLDSRSKAKRDVEAQEFMDDKRQVLIFSQAGGTGKSYHASVRAKNQRLRVHYVLQAGFSAPPAVQGLGRTHRSAQKQAPVYRLVTTDMKGHKRFISTIARRLDQLGALTRGQRDAGSQGLFSARDNLESTEAKDALRLLYKGLARNTIAGLQGMEVFKQLGLDKSLFDQYGQLIDGEDLRNTTQFLNRLLSTKRETQNQIFDAYSDILDEIINNKKLNGTLDQGMENFKADKIEKREEVIVRQDETSGAETKYVQLEAYNKLTPITFKEALEDARAAKQYYKKSDFIGFYKNSRSGNIRAVIKRGSQTLDDGRIEDVYQLYGQRTFIPDKLVGDKFTKSNWEKVTDAEAQAIWDEAVAKLPEYDQKPIHMITGVLLPIWSRLPQESTRVMRVITDDGEELLGRIIPEKSIDITLQRLGADRKKGDYNIADVVKGILKQGNTVTLSNGWKINRRKIKGEYRIEITGDGLYESRNELRNKGVYSEIIAYTTRYFIPIGDKAEEVFASVIKYNPITNVSVSSVGSEFEGTDDTLGAVAPGFAGKLKTPKTGFTFSNPAIEKKHTENAGIKEPTRKEKINKLKNDVANTLTRTFKSLPETGEFAEIKKDLLHQTKVKGISVDEVVRKLKNITRELNEDSFNVFSRVVLLLDLQQDAELGLDLPNLWTDKQVEAELQRAWSYAKDKGFADTVVKALETRKDLWDELTTKYSKAMKDVGFNPSDRFKRDNYFRHIVLGRANNTITIGGKKVKVNTSRSWLKGRTGYTGDINTDYYQAEYEVMTQMLVDTHTAQVIKRINKKYNILPELKERARDINNAVIDRIIAQERADEKVAKDKKGRTPTELAMLNYNQRIARAYAELSEMARADKLWKGEHGEFSEVVKALKAGVPTDTQLEVEEVELPYYDGVFRYLAKLAQQAKDTPGIIQAKSVLKSSNDKREAIKGMLGKAYTTWEDIIPEGYGKWQPRPGRIMFIANAVPDQVIEELADSVGKTLGIKDIHKVLAIGKQRQSYVIQQEIIDTLDDINRKPIKDGALDKLAASSMNFVKRWYLTLNPRKFTGYLLKNTAGDLDRLISGMATKGAFQTLTTYSWRAAGELKDAYLFGRFTPELKGWYDKGGFEALFTVQEIYDINKVSALSGNNDKNLLQRWESGTAAVNNYRESILRYASYLYYTEELKNNKTGLPKNYGYSKPDVIRGLDTIEDRAYKLSKDLIGAYDEVSEAGQWLRRFLLPFWSIQEIQLTGYYQLMKNAINDGSTAERVGRGLTAGLKVGASAALRIGSLALKVHFATVLLQIINNIFRPLDEELPEEVRNQAHIVLGRDLQGNVLYQTDITSLGNYLSWFGLEDLPGDVMQVISGQKSFKKAIEEYISADQLGKTLKAPVSNFVNQLNPIVKTLGEAAAGVSVYPDLWNARPLRDKALHIFQSAGVGEEYKAIKGLPSRPYIETWKSALAKVNDSGQTAYYDILDYKRKFEKAKGKERSDFINTSEKSKALYNFKLALRLEDKKAAEKYLLKYAENGGTVKGLKQSLKMLDPFYGLKAAEFEEFINTIPEKERHKLKAAYEYFQSVINN